jgi:hypothetical protein
MGNNWNEIAGSGGTGKKDKVCGDGEMDKINPGTLKE